MDETAPRRVGSPLYVQLAAQFRRLIARNAWPLGSRVDTVEALAEEYGVARITVRQAMDILEREGLIDRARGRGTHVRALPQAVRWHRLAGAWDDFLWSPPGGRTRVLEDRPHEGPPPDLAPGEAVPRGPYRFLHVVTARGDGPPLTARRVWVQERIHRRIRDRIAEGMLMALLCEHAERMTIHAEVVAADPGTARLLEIPVGTPVFENRHLGIGADGSLAFLERPVLRGDYLKFEIILRRRRTRGARPRPARPGPT
jgi:GntR family transcriptional regulator